MEVKGERGGRESKKRGREKEREGGRGGGGADMISRAEEGGCQVTHRNSGTQAEVTTSVRRKKGKAPMGDPCQGPTRPDALLPTMNSSIILDILLTRYCLRCEGQEYVSLITISSSEYLPILVRIQLCLS